MNALSTTRADVATVLTAAGLNAVYSIPDRITPPVAVIMPGSPYVEDGTTYTNNLIRLVVRVITNAASNEVMADDLDAAISSALIALSPDQWNVSVSEPFALVVGTAEFPAADITITNWITL